MHLVITDSGLGGLTVCAGLEKALRGSGTRLTYVNAWPEPGRGYNDYPDLATRAQVFDRVLDGITRMGPDAILIACNTLSIVYEHTRFKAAGSTDVQGIVDGGVSLFVGALADAPGSAIVLIGTRTTIESDVHRARMIALGAPPEQIASASCHGLATAIERGPGSDATTALIATCAERAASASPPGEPLFLGLACTHYGMVGDRLAAAVAARAGRTVRTLDPNTRMVASIVSRLGSVSSDRSTGARSAEVEIMSKVELSPGQREGVARIIETQSPATAAALRAYRLEPDLF